MQLVHEAYKVRYQHFGNRVHVQVLKNIKSGLCSEDCRYCAQSRISKADIEKYPLISKDALLGEARKAARINATRFCMATSGTRLDEQEIDQLCDAIMAIKKETHLPLCASVGLITDDQARQLKAAGLDRVNHNLNTSRIIIHGYARPTLIRIVSIQSSIAGRPDWKYVAAGLSDRARPMMI